MNKLFLGNNFTNMSKILFFSKVVGLLAILVFLTNCQTENKEMEATESEIVKPLSAADFTPYEKIDPNIYFASPENIAIDPNNALMDVFRKKKTADMANPDKPRPLPAEEILAIENISHQQPWGNVASIFKFDWEQLPASTLTNLNKTVKTRMVFDNLDLKVVELAIASGGVLPTHAQPTPSVYLILGGEGEVLSNDSIAKVYTGTSIKFDSYDKKRVKVTSEEPLKILWFSWAPEGDKSYLESGYYLTGSNLHIQSINAVLPNDFQFWEAADCKPFEFIEIAGKEGNKKSSFVNNQITNWNKLEKSAFYPNTPTFRSSSQVDWVDVMKLDPKSFFFAKDLKSLGSSLEMMSKLAKIKSVFRVKRPDSGYDLNYSYLVWGPESKYITHSHAICEFYYILEGDVEYIINGEKYHGVPGNFYFHPPYYDHEMRGLTKSVSFSSISGSWIPHGKRELFDLPFLLLEDVENMEGGSFPDNFNFHNFKMKKGQQYGVL